ncbi:MAG: SIS domain-containing protein, partial [Psychrilyobacter sp.]|uniref:SIS domain-containing protein n=1 Tax=Psychrilyobacter sp. TaxID=2586924 RepID=UPI003C77CE5D
NQTIEIIEEKLEEINKFLIDFDKKNTRVIFTGAGTSEFVGNSIVDYLNKKSEFKIESIATTDIVSNPELYLNKDETIILVSCARSGNSPESVATVNLADNLVKNIFHIFLTCNEEGHLAKYSENKKNILLILMPEKSNDKGFAMTGSFTCMSLAGICLFSLEEIEALKNNIIAISSTVEKKFSDIFEIMNKITDTETKRIVCLGDGTLKGTAQEASLKILELSSGYVSVNFDSSLGFRHGPKSVITDETLIVMFMSNNNYTRKYQLDLLNELKKDGGEKKVLVIDNQLNSEIEPNSDHYFTYSNEKMSELNDVFSGFGYIYIIQIYAFLKALKLDINPDNPCPTGEVNRVVQGVILHDYKN